MRTVSSPRGIRRYSSGKIPQKWGALDLWENWEHASPFTAGRHFFNVGMTHEVAFAVDKFGGLRRLPKQFDEYEELARGVEYKYVRGWVAKDGRRMFIWDDFEEVLASPTSHFGHFLGAVMKLRRRGLADLDTELWDRGGHRYLGTLGGLNLLTPPREPTSA